MLEDPDLAVLVEFPGGVGTVELCKVFECALGFGG